MNKKKKIMITIIVVISLLVFVGLFFMISIHRYIDTHTWATIKITGEVNTNTFESEQECLKGDTVSIGNVVLRVTDITHEGEVSFKVEQGKLMDSAGNSIDEVTLTKEDNKEFRLDNGYFNITVISNRFQ